MRTTFSSSKNSNELQVFPNPCKGSVVFARPKCNILFYDGMDQSGVDLSR